MGFYGNITNTSRTHFHFDKIYPNRHTLEINTATDGVYIGRYVLIEYGQNFSLDQADKVYLKEGKFYTSPNFEAETEINLIPNSYIRTDETIYYIDNDLNIKEISEVEDNTYDKNYNEDKKYYKDMGRGYDSTVWQKTFVDGIEKYVMIAELNTVVPTFDVSADAPTMAPVTPHFDVDSTNVYYKLHWQPSWGFRVKEAEGVSDEQTTWVQKTYDPSTGTTQENTSTVNAAIYYNKAGFDPEKIAYSEETNSIKIAPTGVSGNLYNTHNTLGEKAKAPDIQELSIILPSIGNSIAKMWNIVYGDKEINNDSTIRNMDIQWREADADVKEKEKGLRLVTTGEDGYIYNPKQVNTLAGVINSVHDLMGMIIKTDDVYTKETAPVNKWRSDFIYYLSQEDKFYRKAKEGYKYTEVDNIEGYKDLYVVEETKDFPKGYKWNINIPKPEGVKLGTREEIYVLKELDGFAKNYNTIHGLILRLNEVLDETNEFKEELKNLILQFKEFGTNQVIMTNEFGQLINSNFEGDNWISIQNNKSFKHKTQTIQEETTEKTLGFGDTFNSFEIGYDTAGHINSIGTKTYTLPELEYSKINELVKTNTGATFEENLAQVQDLKQKVENLDAPTVDLSALSYSSDINKNQRISKIAQIDGKISIEKTTVVPEDIGAAPVSHNQSASTITSGTLSSDRLPTVPVAKGGTGATDAATARSNLNAQENLGFTPVQQGTGVDQRGNTIKIGWSGAQLLATVDSTNLGNFVFGNNVSRVNLLHNGASISSGSVINIGTGAEGYKYLVTTIDSEPCIFHVTGDGGIACTKYVNNNDCFIFYGIKINSYSGGNISFGTVRLCKLDNNKLNTLDNTSVVLGPIYGII